MDSTIFHPRSLKLLVSVRNLHEALTVQRVGVDILDVKEPNVGPLGKAGNAEIEKIITAIKGATPVSAALGELAECEAFLQSEEVPQGLSFAKCGLAHSIGTDWQDRLVRVWNRIQKICQPVAVGYADWEVAKAPSPEDVLQHAVENNIRYFLVDTYTKDGETCFDKTDHHELSQLIRRAKLEGIQTVLAGTITGGDLEQVMTIAPDFVGVRGAVCDQGRAGPVSQLRLGKFKSLLA